ncbi:MAG: S8 family serine peptidase, partial [Cyanobacteria bacterium Co-bin8]|nr:S8 family serine peptidase [Cyanobacteria bacterium Co-bin8]
MSQPKNFAQSANTHLQSSAAEPLRSAQPGGLAPQFQTQQHQSVGNNRLTSALPTENPLASSQVMRLEEAFAAATNPTQPTLAQSLQNRAPSWLRQGIQGMQQWLGKGHEAVVSPLPQTQGPLIGIIDTGFAPGQHGHQMLQTIQGGNPEATILLAGGIGKGTWADSLTKFVDTAKATGQTRAVVNASFDLTQKNPDGSITTRQELTAQEKAALNYARENGVLVVASAGNEGKAMSALGRASGLSDNLIVVGNAEGNDRAAYSSYGKGLDFLFANGSDRSAGTSASAAKTTQTIAQIWAANPNLTPQQVVQTLEATAIDLQKPGWDNGSGLGIVNPEAALHYAATVAPPPEWMAQMGFTQPANNLGTPTWNGSGGAVATERSNRNLRRAAGKIFNIPALPKRRISGAAKAVGRAATAAVRNNPRPSSGPRPRISRAAKAIGRAATAAVRNNPRPSSGPRPRISRAAKAVGRAATAAVRNNPRPSSGPRPRGSGFANASTGGSTALRGYIRLPGRQNPKGSGVAGAIAGGAVALGNRLPLIGGKLTGRFRSGNAIARAQRVTKQIEKSPSSSSLIRGVFNPSLNVSSLTGRSPSSAGTSSFNLRQPRTSVTRQSIPGFSQHTLVGLSVMSTPPGVIQGMREGVDSLVQDFQSSVQGIGNALNNPAQALQDLKTTVGTTVQAIREDPVGVGREVVNSVVEPYADDWNNGRYDEVAGRGIVDLATSLIPGGAAARILRPLVRQTGRGGRGPAASPPPTPGGAAPRPRPAPQPSTGGSGLGSGPNSSSPGRAPSSGRAPGPQPPNSPRGRGPAAPNPSGRAPNRSGAAPGPRPARPPIGGNGRGPGSSSSPRGSEPPTPGGSPVNPSRPQQDPPAQNPPPAAGRPSPHPVNPSRRANSGGGGPRTRLHPRQPQVNANQPESNRIPEPVGAPRNLPAPNPQRDLPLGAVGGSSRLDGAGSANLPRGAEARSQNNGPVGRGPDSSDSPGGAPNPSGGSPGPSPAPQPSTGGSGPGSGSNSFPPGRALSLGGAPGPQPPTSPS